MLPSLFNDEMRLFDTAMDAWFNDRDFKNVEKKLYGHNAKNIMSTDVKETEKGYEMMVDLPGFCKDEVKVELENGYLTISAAKGLNENEKKPDCEGKECKYIRRERYCGAMSRTFFVGDKLKKEDVKAAFKHGILTLNFPKTENTTKPENCCITIDG